jgi:hypothetical protein
MKRNRLRRKVVIKRKSRARPDDLAQKYREVCELRRKLECVTAAISSLRQRSVEA